MHRHANIRHVCETYGAQVLGITPDDTTFSVAKMFFAYGIGNTVFFPLSVGATTVLEPRRPSPDIVRERLEQTRPTLFFGVPTFYAALSASELPDDAFSSVRLCASAGEPLPAPLQKRFTDRFGVEILDGIGSTEALHIFLSNRPGDIRPGTTGMPVPGYELQIRDDRRQPVADGEPGALHVRGESIALGYWHRTDASRAVFQGEWLSTGDTYVRDERGLLLLPGAQQRHAQGRWHLGLAGRGGERACSSTRQSARPRSSESPTPTASTSRSPWSSCRRERRTRSWSSGVATGSRTSRRLARSSSSTTSRRPRPASCSASRCAASGRGRPEGAEDLSATPRGDVTVSTEGRRGRHPDRRRRTGGPVRRLLRRRPRPLRRRGRLAEPARRPGHRDVPGEADLRHRRLPAVSGRELVKGLVAQADQYEPTYLLGQEAQEHRRDGLRRRPDAAS